MDVVATAKFVRLSASKARDLTRRMQGLPVGKALEVTLIKDRKAAELVGKTLKSAIGNAEHNAKLAVDDLWVKEAAIEEGPSLKRHWPRARGGASPIKRRTCHIRIVLTDGKDEGEGE